MFKAATVAVAAALICSGPALAAPAADATAALAQASRALGSGSLDAIRYYGSAMNFQLGQNNNANGPWPQTPLNDYNRWIDFKTPALRSTAVTWASPVTGGPAVQGAFNQIVPAGAQNWGQALEIWITPWGFLKGAAAHGATLTLQKDGQRMLKVLSWNAPLKAPSGKPYRLVGYIGPSGLVERVDTWVENPVFGDLRVVTRYSDWRDADGLKYPSTIRQSRAGWPAFEAQILGVEANPADVAAKVAAPPSPTSAGPPPAAPQGPASDKLAEGVWRIRGAYNAMAVEFKDHVLIFEPGPQNEARAQAILAETRRLVPGKPIRYGVISHHHFDHTSGLSAVVAEGVTIVTTDTNKAFFERALSAPRTLAPDAIARSGRKPKVEGMVGDKRVFSDGERTFELHRIKGLPHADGLVVGWLPKEKILVYADMFNLPPANDPVPNPAVVGTQVFLANLERLGIEPERLLSIHTLAPDRLATMQDIRSSLGKR